MGCGALTGVGVTGVVLAVLEVVGAGAASAALRTLTVESSFRAVPRVGGRVPCQPCVGDKGSVRRSLCRTCDGGMICAVEDEERGRSDAKTVKESRMLCAERKGSKST